MQIDCRGCSVVVRLDCYFFLLLLSARAWPNTTTVLLPSVTLFSTPSSWLKTGCCTFGCQVSHSWVVDIVSCAVLLLLWPPCRLCCICVLTTICHWQERRCSRAVPRGRGAACSPPPKISWKSLKYQFGVLVLPKLSTDLRKKAWRRNSSSSIVQDWHQEFLPFSQLVRGRHQTSATCRSFGSLPVPWWMIRLH